MKMLLKNYIFNIYRHIMMERCDNDGTMFYFSAKDFPGLSVEEYPFPSSAGHLLQGYIYSYSQSLPNRLVVFEHGMGDGHLPYMKEIETLCRNGFRVFAYDHTGCMRSGGDSTNGFAQSLCDLNDCISAIKNDHRFQGTDISVVGHSWGGYSAMNITELHPDISHVVSLCGYVSIRILLESHLEKYLKRYVNDLLDYERKLNPAFADYNAAVSLSRSHAKTLLIYSDNDKKCKPIHYEFLKQNLTKNDNIRLMIVHNKDHNPTYTPQAICNFKAYTKKRRRRKRLGLLKTTGQKASFVSSFDWDSITEQDASVWREIISHLRDG